MSILRVVAAPSSSMYSISICKPLANARCIKSSTVSPFDQRATILVVGLGFAMILPIIPFHSWMPLLAGETNPYSSAYLFFLLPTVVFFFIYQILIRYSGTGVAPEMYATLRTIGILMVLSGGLWSIYENHLGRLLGFITLHQIGSGLLALSLNEIASSSLPLAGLFFALLIPGSFGLAIYAQSVSILQLHFPSLYLKDISGVLRSFPIASSGALLSLFSLAGLPLLASFPVYYPIWSALARAYPSLAFLAVLGSAFLFIAGLRLLLAFTRAPSETPWRVRENRLQGLYIGIGSMCLLVIGLALHLFIPSLTNMAILLSNPFP
jgi:NADH:ubiquinone oxidoreductase subunit 2 (subunit N)